MELRNHPVDGCFIPNDFTIKLCVFCAKLQITFSDVNDSIGKTLNSALIALKLYFFKGMRQSLIVDVQNYELSSSRMWFGSREAELSFGGL